MDEGLTRLKAFFFLLMGMFIALVMTTALIAHARAERQECEYADPQFERGPG